jgi:hypothetical protein
MILVVEIGLCECEHERKSKKKKKKYLKSLCPVSVAHDGVFFVDASLLRGSSLYLLSAGARTVTSP